MTKSRRLFSQFPLPTLLAAILLACSSQVAGAASLFFGIDQGNGTPPTSPNNSLVARTSFAAALGTPAVDDLESHPVGRPPTTLSFAGSTITATSTYAPNESINNADDSGAAATSGTHYLDAQGLRDDRLLFTAPIAGFGFYATDVNDGTAGLDQLSLIATFADNTTQTFTTSFTTNNANANLLFLGIVSTTSLITQVEILNTFPAIDDVHGLDDLTIGTAPTPVPLPSPIYLAAPTIALIAIHTLLTNRKTARSRYFPRSA